jgi:DNA repair exonuclease SbcCD nuclease subunit
MTEFSFIHAADLHLDAPFRGLRASRPDPGRAAGAKRLDRLLRDATFLALDRLVDLCIRSGADFLLLAGDVYNSAESSLRARLALRDAFVRLEAAGMEVFLAHGNHDPLPEGKAVIPWPDNVRVFGKQVGVCAARRRGGERSSGAALALVHGISHAGPREGRNLARLFRRAPIGPTALAGPDPFQIGLLHCALADLSGAHEAYAPCAFGDLAAADLDYWALGHVHAARLLDSRGRPLSGGEDRVFAAYSGSAQGLHINENGAHGCLLVRVDAGKTARVTRVPLAPLRWEQMTVEPGPETEDIPCLERLLLERLEEFAPGRDRAEPGQGCPAPAVPSAGRNSDREALFDLAPEPASVPNRDVAPGGEGRSASPPAHGYLPEAVLVRLVLAGRSPLNHELREPGALEALREHLEAALSGSGVWIHDGIVATRPLVDVRAAASRPDLAGEILRAGFALRDDPAALSRMAEPALAPLFQRARLRKATVAPDAAELAVLLEEAAFVCLDLLGAGAGELEEGGTGDREAVLPEQGTPEESPGALVSPSAALPGNGTEGG